LDRAAKEGLEIQVVVLEQQQEVQDMQLEEMVQTTVASADQAVAVHQPLVL
jgi:hypothetical protein